MGVGTVNMKKVYYVFLLLLIGCKPVHQQGLDSIQTITKVFDESEIKDLEKILHFFNKQICKTENIENTDVNECYQRFFKRMKEQEKTGEFETEISFQEQENMYKQISESTFNQIWVFAESCHPDSPESLKEIVFNNNGKYLKYLKELGRKNDLIKNYYESYNSVGDISPTMIGSVLMEYEEYNISDVRIQLLIAIHYLTLNDQDKRKDIYQDEKQKSPSLI